MVQCIHMSNVVIAIEIGGDLQIRGLRSRSHGIPKCVSP